jgi:transposase
VITRESAVLAFDLAADKQVCVLTDQDSKVLARRTVRCKAWELSEAVSWGLARAAEAGFTHVVVACEPTGHRWRVLDQITAELGVRLVCVGPLLVHRAREAEDFTRNKNDDTDAMIIARLVTELRCYLPERADSPAVLGAASDPLESKSWLAAVTVALDRIDAGGDLSVIRRWGWTRFAAAVRRELGATRWYSAIVRAVFDAATDPAHADVGVSAQRAGALERVVSALADLAARRTEITEVEARMLGVLGHLGLTELVTTIPGVSTIGAVTILAESGDPTRFSSARALVKHAGLCPRDNSSGTYQGKTGISGRGRPQLRLAAWRAVFTALRHNPVLAARHAHLTGRADNPLTDTQARVAVAASLLRQLHAVVVTGTAWDPAIAAGLDRREDGAATAA